MERRLKNYLIYQDKIEAYAKACNIKIVYAPEDSDGSFSPTRSIVKIDDSLSEVHEIAVLLHELGHCLDDTLANKKTFARIDKAYTAVYSNKHSKAQLALVITCEERAWEYGRSIAKRLRIRLGKWYELVRQHCLAGYHR